MSKFSFNISSKIDQLKKALSSFGDKELDSSKFKGNAVSIFDSLNEEYSDAFKNSGMKELLIGIAGEDGEISESELNSFMKTDGDDSLTAADFEKYALNALDDALKDYDVNSDMNESGKVQKENNVEEVKTKVLDDGTVCKLTYNSDGTKKIQEKQCPDGTSISSEFIYDSNGNKIGAITTRYDVDGNLQSVTEAKYDEQGRQTYGKTVDADGTLVGEANYKYQENADGTTSQLRYNMSGILTNTVVYKDNINEPISKTNNITNSIETFEKKPDGTTTSVTKSAKGNTLEENTYNSDGNITFKTVYNEFGEKIAEITYTYYDNGYLKDENRVDFETSKHESEITNVNTNNDINSTSSKISKKSNGFSLGLTGEELAEIARNVGGSEGTKDWCLRGVNDSLEVAYGFRFSYPSAYMALEGIRAKEGFEEITSDYSNPEDLKNLPAGAIVIWDKCDSYVHGHISIALGDGTEASDCIRNQITHLGTSSYHVFMPA